jgi:hypothetical protein
MIIRTQIFSRLVPVAAAICLVCWFAIAVRPFHAWDDAEPEILNQAWRLAQGKEIYRSIDEPPYLHAAYPPLYFALVAPLLKLSGLNYLPAKLLSFLSVIALGAALAALSRRWQTRAGPGWWALCLLCLLPAFFYNSARVHVQMLAVTLSLWSFVLFLRRGNPATILSAILAVLAIYTKQTQLALPLALSFYLIRRDRGRLPVYLATLAIAGLIPFFWLQWKTAGYFWRQTVTLNALSYQVTDLPLVLLHHAGPFFLALGLAGREVWRRLRERRAEEIDFYFLAVAITTAVSCGRLGAHTQYVVELCVVAVAVMLRAESLPGTSMAWQAAILLLYAPLYIMVEEGPFARASNQAAPEVRKLLDSAPGPVLAQQSSFSLFTRGEIHIQLFHFTALARAGLWDGERLRREVDDRYFTWAVTEFPLEDGDPRADDLERFTPEVIETLRRRYRRVATVGPYFIYQAAR